MTDLVLRSHPLHDSSRSIRISPYDPRSHFRLSAVLLGTSCQGLEVNTVARISSGRTACVSVASDNEAMCSLPFVKDNRCGGWVVLMMRQSSLASLAVPPSQLSFAWWLETWWQSPSHPEVSVCHAIRTQQAIQGPTLVVQSLRGTEMSRRPLQESSLAGTIYDVGFPST